MSLPLRLIFHSVSPFNFKNALLYLIFKSHYCPRILRTSDTHGGDLMHPHCIPNSLYFSSQMILFFHSFLSRSLFLKIQYPTHAHARVPPHHHTPLFPRPIPLETPQLGHGCLARPHTPQEPSTFWALRISKGSHSPPSRPPAPTTNPSPLFLLQPAPRTSVPL